MNQHKQLACAVLDQCLTDLDNARKTKSGRLYGDGVASAVRMIFTPGHPMLTFWCESADVEPHSIRLAARRRLERLKVDVEYALWLENA